MNLRATGFLEKNGWPRKPATPPNPTAGEAATALRIEMETHTPRSLLAMIDLSEFVALVHCNAR